MARNYANISTGIWRQEEDFTDLSVQAQWAYLMLVSQPDISAAGVLSINVRRWTRRAKDASRELIVGAISELGEARFVVYDQDTEELLVRTFVKWDGGYGNPKRQPVIRRAAQEVESSIIRQALAAEFDKLGFAVEGVTDSHGDSLSSHTDSLSDSHADGGLNGFHPEALDEPNPSSDDRASSQEDRLSDSLSPSDGVVVTQGLIETTTHNPQSATPPSGRGRAKRSPTTARQGARLPDDWKPDTHLLSWLDDRKVNERPLRSLVDVDLETEKFRNHFLAKTGRDATKRDWGRAWQNWMIESAQRANRFTRNGSRASPNGPYRNKTNQDEYEWKKPA